MPQGRRLFWLSLLRHLLTVFAGALTEYGASTSAPVVAAAGTVPFLGSLIWSALAWWHAEQRVDVALTLPAGSSRDELETRIADLRRQTFP